MKNEQTLTYSEAAKMFKIPYSTFLVKTSRAEFAKFRIKTKRMYQRKKYNTTVYRIVTGFVINDEFREKLNELYS